MFNHSMDCLIVTGGKTPDFSYIQPLLNSSPYIIAADSGLDYCRVNGLVPDSIVGDFDSLSEKKVLNAYRDEIITSYPEDKDYTDSELALEKALELNFSSLGIIGGGEGRSDHFLSLVHLFSNTAALKLWVTAREKIYKITGQFKGYGHSGGLISFFPLSKTVSVSTCSGIKWSLNGLDWNTIPYSLSNRITSNTFEISVDNGELLVLQSL